MKRRDLMLTIGAATAAMVVDAGTTARASGGPTSGAKSKIAIGHGFHATMTAKTGMGDALIDLLFQAPAFENKDCVVFLVGRSKSNPDVIHLTEGWTSEQAHKQFAETETAKAYTARFGPLVADSAYLDEIPIGGKAAID